jgi:hypothetical protein
MRTSAAINRIIESPRELLKERAGGIISACA